MHGYEMMKALEEKSGGFYSPSAGTIYPTLQMLEDRNLVTSNEADGKKVYSITDAGRALLEQQQKESESFQGPPWARGFGPKGRRGFRNAPEMQALGTETREVARLFAIAARSSFNNPEQAARLRTIIESTRKDLSDLIYGSGAGTGTNTDTPPESTGTPGVEQA
jgi:DNA-binding PadR family transcriptional regulator